MLKAIPESVLSLSYDLTESMIGLGLVAFGDDDCDG
jgi:hypothetical protein